MLWFCHIRHHFMMFLGNTWRLKGTFLKLPFLKRSGLLFFFQPSTTEALLLGLVVRHGYVGFDPCTFLRQRRLQFSEWPGLRSHVIPAMEFCSWISMFMHQSCWWSSIAGNFTSNREQNKLKCERICEKNNNSRASGIQKLLPIVDFFQVQLLICTMKKGCLRQKSQWDFLAKFATCPKGIACLKIQAAPGTDVLYSCFAGLAYRANPLRTLDVVHRMPEIPNLPSKMWSYETNVLNRGGTTSYSGSHYPSSHNHGSGTWLPP